ncbi:Peptidase S10 [Theobroma cacao]|nr:Peptidase S10 [Theobroma cacao]
MNDLIEKLPGQPNVTFKQFSGYIDVDGKAGRSLFYYFVEAENDPMKRPLTIWLTGGPGCGSVGDGFLSVGPFITTANAHGLQRNLYSWIKVSNLLFIDSPIGAGWSYSNTSSDYEVGDDSTSKIMFNPIFSLFSFTKTCSHSYSNGLKSIQILSLEIYILADQAMQLGNPLLRNKLDTLAVYDFFWSRGMININLHQQILKECNGIDEDNYSNNATKCDVDKDIDMLPALKKILQQSIPITIFSGDQDAIVPTVGTLNHVNKLAKDMNLNLTKDEAWNHGNKGGGWMYSYGDLLTLMTVKGANHHRSQCFSSLQRKEYTALALLFFTSFISGRLCGYNVTQEKQCYGNDDSDIVHTTI